LGIGYPDFFGQSIFLSYGVTQRSSFLTGVGAGSVKDIHDISAKGLLQYLKVFITPDLFDGNISSQIYIDDTLVTDWEYQYLFTDYRGRQKDVGYKCTYIDLSSGVIILELKGQLTFSSNIRVTLNNACGSSVAVRSELIYTEVVQ